MARNSFPNVAFALLLVIRAQASPTGWKNFPAINCYRDNDHNDHGAYENLIKGEGWKASADDCAEACASKAEPGFESCDFVIYRYSDETCFPKQGLSQGCAKCDMDDYNYALVAPLNDLSSGCPDGKRRLALDNGEGRIAATSKAVVSAPGGWKNFPAINCYREFDHNDHGAYENLILDGVRKEGANDCAEACASRAEPGFESCDFVIYRYSDKTCFPKQGLSQGCAKCDMDDYNYALVAPLNELSSGCPDGKRRLALDNGEGGIAATSKAVVPGGWKLFAAVNCYRDNDHNDHGAYENLLRFGVRKEGSADCAEVCASKAEPGFESCDFVVFRYSDETCFPKQGLSPGCAKCDMGDYNYALVAPLNDLSSGCPDGKRRLKAFLGGGSRSGFP